MKTIYAYSDCPHCHGYGTVYDSVPYGATSASMESECESCVERAFDDGLLTVEEFDYDYEMLPSQETHNE